MRLRFYVLRKRIPQKNLCRISRDFFEKLEQNYLDFLVDVEAFLLLVVFLFAKEVFDFLQDLLQLQESCSTAKDQKYSF